MESNSIDYRIISKTMLFISITYYFYFSTTGIVNLLPSIGAFSGYDPISSFSGLTSAASLGNVIRFDGYSTCDGGTSLGTLSYGGSLPGDTRILSSGDPDDWFWFYSSGDQPVTLSLTSPSGSDFDAYIYRNTAGCAGETLVKSCTQSPPSPEVCTGFTPVVNAVYDVKIHRYSGSGEATFTIAMPDTTAPSKSISSSPASPITSGTQIDITVTAADPSGVNNIQVYNQEASAWLPPEVCDGATSCTKHFYVTPSSIGVKKYNVYAADQLGNDATQNDAVTYTVTDGTAPVISAGSPSGVINSGVITMSVTTDENANCRYSGTANTAYDSMTDLFTTGQGTTSHSTSLGSLGSGLHNRHVRCADGVPNKNTADYTVSFTANDAPVIVTNELRSAIDSRNILSNPDIASGNSLNVYVSATDDRGISSIQYADTAGSPFGSMSCVSGGVYPMSCVKTFDAITPSVGAHSYDIVVYDKDGRSTSSTIGPINVVNSCASWTCPALVLGDNTAGLPSISDAQYVNYVNCAAACTCPAGTNIQVTEVGNTELNRDFFSLGGACAGVYGASSGPISLLFNACGTQSASLQFTSDYSVHTGSLATTKISCVSTDTTPPSTTDNSDTAWHSGDVTVTLTCTDNVGGTGCKQVQYCTVPWIPGVAGPVPPCGVFTTVAGLTASAAMTQSGYVFYKSTDNAVPGNTESLKQSGIVKIDKNSPTSIFLDSATTPVGSTPADGAWVNKNGFTITVKDDDLGGSDLKSCKYTICSNIDGGTCNDAASGDMTGTCSGASSTVTKSITVGSTGNCKDQGASPRCRFQAYAVDNADRSSSVVYRTYKVDYTDPAVSITSPPATSAPAFDIAWTVSDATSGPSFVGIYVNGVGVSTCSSGSACWDAGGAASGNTHYGKISYPGALGNTYNIQAYAGDVAGNVGPLGAVTSTRTVGLPSLSSPTDGGDITTLIPVLDWTDVTDVNCYAVQVYDGGTLALEDFPASSIYTVNSNPSAWKPGYTSLGWQKTYSWRVWPSANSCGSFRSPTALWSFNTKMSAPTLTSPVDGATTSMTPKLQWNAVTGASCYKVDVLNSAGTIVLNTANVGTNYRDVPAGVLGQGISYKWRASASPSACGASPAFGTLSPQRGFTTGPACADPASSCGISYTQVTTSGPWLYNHCDIDCSSKSLIKTGVWAGHWVFTTPSPYSGYPSFDTTITVGKDGTLNPLIKIGTTVDGNDICDWSASCKRGLTPSTTYYITIGGAAGEGNAWPTVSATYNSCGITTPPFSNSITVGSCSITMNHVGFDYNDKDVAGDNGAVRYKDNGQLTSVDRQIEYSDTPTGGCSVNMKFKNVWDAGSINPNTLRVNTIGVEKNAAHYLLHGYSLQTSNCKFDKNFKIVSLAFSPDLPSLNLDPNDKGMGQGLGNYNCDTGAMTNLNCELASGVQYIKVLQGSDVGAAQTLVVDLPVYECLPGENVNDPRAGFAGAANGYNGFCNFKDASKPYCDATLKKCYGCSVTNNNPSGDRKPNLKDCGVNPQLVIGKCDLAVVGGVTAANGGSCRYDVICNLNNECSTACCSYESIPNTGNTGPGKANPPDATGNMCITPGSANNPINPYLCKQA